MTQDRLRIAMVSEHASPLSVVGGADAGGQNVHVAELARHLAQLGAEVTVHTRRDDTSLPPRVGFGPGVVVDHVDAGPPISLPKDELGPWMDDFARGLVRSWRADPPDVVHAHFWMSGLAARAAARELGLPVALTFHALGSVKQRHQGEADTSPRRRVSAEAQLARTVDLVIATSRDELVELAAVGGRPRAAVVVPCGVDLRAFRPMPSAGEAVQRAARATTGNGRGCAPLPPWPPFSPLPLPWRTSAGRPRVVTVGRLVERKGVADIIDAVAQLPTAELLVAGGPPVGQLDKDHQARRLGRRADAAGISPRVKLLGAVPRPAMPTLLASADVVCLYPWYEPFGIVALEAMACGIPVVASATGGLTETVVDGITGRLVPPRNPKALAATLDAVLGDPAARRTLGRNGLRRAARYSWEVIAAETYGHLCGLARGERALVATMGSLEVDEVRS